MSYEERLVQHTINTRDNEPRFLIFRSLHLLNIIRLQNDLAKCKNTIWAKGSPTSGETGKLTTLLHEYTNAIRDYEYLGKLIPITGSQAENDRLDLEQAFMGEVGDFSDMATSYRRFADTKLRPTDALRDVLKRMLPRSVAYTKSDKYRRNNEYFSGDPPEEVSHFVDVIARFIVAIFGGALLIIPMLIMSLPRVSLGKSLITTSVSVLLFSGALSVFFKASNTDTLIATTTYAAVLVVFVGISTGLK
ncbi:hypothetical protein IQ07DRAFT_524208 [Pyrenochaeta sp. DS3sAY3a]|nr:hypothetical protein IQ07DRAFT_524208 [Pyrenochaeta sp. DS3sAY3a]